MNARVSKFGGLKKSAKQQWAGFKRSRPGRRFQDYYERQQKARQQGGSSWARPLRWILALIAFAIGVVLAVAPGPAVLFFAIAGALLAADSKVMARFMDWSEVKLRVIVIPLMKRWKRLRPAAKAAIASVTAVSGAALSIVVYLKLKG